MKNLMMAFFVLYGSFILLFAVFYFAELDTAQTQMITNANNQSFTANAG